MAFYLNDMRRAALLANLTCGLSVPFTIAQDFVNIPDTSIPFLDKTISAVIWRVAERFEQLQETHNPDKAQILLIMMAGDIVCLAAYLAEAQQRRIPEVMFPRVSKAINASAEEVGAAVRLVLSRSEPLQ